MQCRSQDAVELSKTGSHAACAHLASTVRCSLGSSALAIVVFTPFPINKPAWKCTRLQLLSEIAQGRAKIPAFISGCGQAVQAQEPQQPGLCPFRCLLALLSTTRAQDVAGVRTQPALPDVTHQHPGLPPDPQQGSELPLSLPRRKQ